MVGWGRLAIQVSQVDLEWLDESLTLFNHGNRWALQRTLVLPIGCNRGLSTLHQSL